MKIIITALFAAFITCNLTAQSKEISSLAYSDEISSLAYSDKISSLTYSDEISSYTQSEESKSGGALLGIGLHTVIPRASYKTHNDNYGFGIGGAVSGYAANSPLAAGVDFQLSLYDSETWSEKMKDQIYGEDVFEITSYYSIASLTAFFRVQPNQGIFQPYMDFLLGFNYLWASTEIDWDEDYAEDEEYETEFDDIVFSYGVGGGAMIKLNEPTDDGFQLLLNIQARYLFGGKAEYIKRDSKYLEDGNLIYEITSSRTDMFTIRVGVAFRL